MGHLLGHHPQRRADRGGELLLSRVAPALRDVGDALDQVRGLREVAAGRLRINAPPPAVDLVLAPMVGPFLTAHPQVDLDIVSESGFVDIVSAGFDAGVRYGEHLAISTNMSLAMRAARDGVGIWATLDGYADEALKSGALVSLMEDWCEPFPGSFLYYPSRRQTPPALRAFIDFVADWRKRDKRGQ
ncbi:hypothetical protein ASG57_16440 [Bradyrhizobium sp. Leaf396]|jgi:DNA-binding transcriptional LysR family regulator|nr:hypothetical protein ASG57_16440 [Bradyrhizobium sp. Leaf396]